MSQNSSGSEPAIPQFGTGSGIIDEEIGKLNQQLRLQIKKNQIQTQKDELRKKRDEEDYMRKKHARQLFTLYPKLPPELRLKIIKAALDAEVRVVEVQFRRTKGRNTYLSKTLVPGLFHTCQEMRDEAMSIRSGYDRLPTTGVRFGFGDTFINWEKDILFFHTFANLRAFANAPPDTVKNNCQNLAIRLSDVGRFDEEIDGNGLGNIKKVVLLRKIINGSDKGKDLVIKEMPSQDWPRYHQTAWKVAASFSKRYGPSRALEECFVVDATRENESTWKRSAKEEKRGVLTKNEEATLSGEDALLAAEQQERSAALFEDFRPTNHPIFQDGFIFEEYDTDDVLVETQDL